MKKKIALLLSLVFICTMALPLQSFGAGVDTELSNAITKAKNLFTIPSEYSKYESSISSEDGRNIFYLYWRTKGNDAYISVRIDGKGTVLGYENYKYSDHSQSRKLPRISKQEARVKADAFIKKVNSSFFSQIKYEEKYQSDIKDNTYYFSYYRIVNGIPFYNDRVNITVSKETGNVLNYYTLWTEGLTFPKPGQEISVDKAKEAYKSKLGLRLQYKYSYIDGVLKTYLVYTPRFSNDAYAIEAFTGEKVKVGNGYYGIYFTGAMQEKAALDRAAGGNNGVVLSPEEQKAVQDAAKLRTVEDAEKIVRDTEFIGLTKEFELTNSNLDQAYPTKDEYIWSLSFTKPAADKKKASEYISVGINANTGRIIRLYKNLQVDENAEVKFKLEDTKADVKKFLKDNYAELYSDLEYDSDYEETFLENIGNDAPRSYDYKYNRLKNGIEFPDNGITIGYDAVTGIINSLNLEWFTADFPDAENVIGMDNAYTKLFSQIGLEIQYKTASTNNAKVVDAVGSTAQKPEVKLVYSLKEDKPLFLDANNGSVVDSQGNAYKEVKPVSYPDIAKSPAKKEIMVLAENGVYLEGSKFNPEANIKQLDFMILLSKTLSYYGTVGSKSSQKETDDLYTYLEREGIVKSGEKSPAAEITREDAVKFIIRAMKYDKVADIKGIFKSSLKDIGNVQSGLVGYITIAEGLKIITGTKGYFHPDKKLTREAATVMIYNYLQA